MTDVLDELMCHEERFWLGSAQAQGLLSGSAGLTNSDVRRIVAAGCLLGAADGDEAVNALGRVPHVTPSRNSPPDCVRSTLPNQAAGMTGHASARPAR
jgi:hypothetical protein